MSPDIRQPAPEAAQAQPFDGRRGGFRRPGEGQPDASGARSPLEAAPPPVRREMPQPVPDAGKGVPADVSPMQRRDGFRRPGESRPETEMRGRPPESVPAPMRRDMPAPDMRAEERQPRPMMQPQERESRREMPDIQRMERPVPPPREREAQPIMRQPEMQRPAPEVRMQAPPPVREMPQQRVEPPRPPVPEFRAPPPAPMPRAEPPRPPVQEFRTPPAPAPMPQQRIEPPRQQPPQGGGQPDPRRRHGDDDRGGR